ANKVYGSARWAARDARAGTGQDRAASGQPDGRSAIAAGRNPCLDRIRGLRTFLNGLGTFRYRALRSGTGCAQGTAERPLDDTISNVAVRITSGGILSKCSTDERESDLGNLYRPERWHCGTHRVLW